MSPNRLAFLVTALTPALLLGGCVLNRSGVTTPPDDVFYCNFYRSICDNPMLVPYQDAAQRPGAYESCDGAGPFFDEKTGTRICARAGVYGNAEEACRDTCGRFNDCAEGRPVNSSAVPSNTSSAFSCDSRDPVVQLPLTASLSTRESLDMTPAAIGPAMSADPSPGVAFVHVSVDGPFNNDESRVVPVVDGRVSVEPLGCRQFFRMKLCDYRFSRIELKLQDFSLFGKTVRDARVAALEPFTVWSAVDAGPQAYTNDEVLFSSSMTANGVPIGGTGKSIGQIFSHVHYDDANVAPWIYLSATIKKTMSNVAWGMDATGTFTIDVWFRESDVDGDGIFDHLDNCKNTQNSDQVDKNGDRIGDACQVLRRPMPL